MRTSTASVRKVFEKTISTALKIYWPVRNNCVWDYESFNERDFHPVVAYKILGLTFLSIFTAWEDYLENSFLRYLAGAKSESLYSPKLRIGKCINVAHARQVLTGVMSIDEATRFMKWNDYDWVLTRAKIFFQKGQPYSLVPSIFQERLRDAQIIRNRVAHSSSKCKNQFRRMTNKNIGASPNSTMCHGFSPGRYLVCSPEIVFDKSWVDSKDCFWGDIFEGYIHMFTELTNLITPYGG